MFFSTRNVIQPEGRCRLALHQSRAFSSTLNVIQPKGRCWPATPRTSLMRWSSRQLSTNLPTITATMIISRILLLVGSWEKHPGHLALCSSIHHSLYTLLGSWGQGMKVQNLKWKGQHSKCSLILNLTTHQVVQYQETRIVSVTEPPDASFYCCEDQSENNRF